DEESIELHRHHLAQRKPVLEDEIQQCKHDTLAQEVDERTLNKRNRPYAAYLLQFQPQYLNGSGVQAVDLLVGEAEAFHQFYITKAFRGAAGQGVRFFKNAALYHLYLFTEQAGEPAQQQGAAQVNEYQPAAEADSIYYHEHDAHN